jgi:hypothetical protein
MRSVKALFWVVCVSCGQGAGGSTSSSASATNRAEAAPECTKVPAAYLKYKLGVEQGLHPDTAEDKLLSPESRRKIELRTGAICGELEPSAAKTLITCLEDPEAAKKNLADDPDFVKRCRDSLRPIFRGLDGFSAPAAVREKGKPTTNASREQLEQAAKEALNLAPPRADPKPAASAQGAGVYGSAEAHITTKVGKPASNGTWFGIEPAVGPAAAECHRLRLLNVWNQVSASNSLRADVERVDDENCWSL